MLAVAVARETLAMTASWDRHRKIMGMTKHFQRGLKSSLREGQQAIGKRGWYSTFGMDARLGALMLHRA